MNSLQNVWKNIGDLFLSWPSVVDVWKQIYHFSRFNRPAQRMEFHEMEKKELLNGSRLPNRVRVRERARDSSASFSDLLVRTIECLRWPKEINHLDCKSTSGMCRNDEISHGLKCANGQLV